MGTVRTQRQRQEQPGSRTGRGWRSGANSNIADIPWFSSHSRAAMSRAAEHGARIFAQIWSHNSSVDEDHGTAGGGALGAPPDAEIGAAARPPVMRRKQPRCVLQHLRGARGRVGVAMYHNACGVHPHACPCAQTDAVERKRTTLHRAVPRVWSRAMPRRTRREGAQRPYAPTRLVAGFKRG